MQLTRRTVLAASYARILGANDRIGVGFIGYGLIGAQHVYDFKDQPDTDLVALSEVFEPRMEAGKKACGPRCKGYPDFRRLLEDKDVQAVVVSTPDHWHALHTMMACAAGKDVYVEKPMTLFVREGRWMADVARRNKRVIQVGTQQRSGAHYQKARDLVKAQYFGKVHSVRMASFRNAMPGFGRPAETAVPADFDYDMWLGPAPARPYSPHRGIYHFRWFWDYSGGQMTNLGAHSIDIMHWFLNLLGPTGVSSSGGRFAFEDDGETPDTQDTLFEYPGMTAIWSLREASAGTRGRIGLEFFGTKGSMVVDRGGYRVIGDAKVPSENTIPQFQGHPVGGPQRRDAPPEKWVEPLEEKGSGAQQFASHVRNFLDCVKSRNETIAPVEDGHRVATASHLGNISIRVGRKLRWNPEKETIAGDPEAAAMLERPYRKPWDRVLRSLL